MDYPANYVVIDDSNFWAHCCPIVGGEMKSHGCVPRPFFTEAPVGYLACAKPFDLPLIPRSEWKDRLAAQKAAKADLVSLRNISGPGGQPIPSRDQNGKGYCWAHSSTSAAMLIRAIMGLAYADLSAYMVACIIKGYRDEGGWGAESLEFIASTGIPSSQFWPQQSMSRSNDNPAMRENAKLHRYTEWMDLNPDSPEYLDQYVTCKLLGLPTINDYNWWSHSVCGAALQEVADNWDGITDTIWNSWGDSWSANGMGDLKGRKARPDSCLAARVMTASLK